MFDYIREMQTVATSIALSQPATANTCTSRDCKYIQHKAAIVEVARLTTGVQNMMKDLEAKMLGLSGGKKVKYTISQNHVDDLSSTARGLSWMDKCRTEPPSQALMLAMVQGGLWNMAEENAQGTGLKWNRIACQHFMERTAEIVDLLITVIHLGGGPPVRGEEIVRDQITNGIQIRTVYLSFGQMLLIRRRAKDTNRRGIDAFNVCYLPASLTDLVCYYLLVIRPLERVIAWEIYGNREATVDYDLYLYVKHGQRMTSAQFSLTLKQLTGKYIGAPITINPARHILIAFMRAFMEPKMIEKGNNIGDLMSSHVTGTALHDYAPEIGNLEGVTDGLMSDVHEFCEHYHDAIGLGSRTGPLISIRTRREIAQKLLLAASMDPGDPGMLGVVREMFQSLGETAFSAGLEHLKVLVVKEVWEAVSEAFDRFTSEGTSENLQSLGPSQGPTRHPVQPLRPPQGPTRHPVHPPHPTQATSVSASIPQTPTTDPRSLKRQGSGAVPAPKRPHTGGETPRTRSDSGTTYPQYQEPSESDNASDQVSENIYDLPWATPDPMTEPSSPALPAPKLQTGQDYQVMSALDSIATLSLHHRPGEDQLRQPTLTAEESGGELLTPLEEREDKQTVALRCFLRNPIAEFRGKQREVLNSIGSCKHTVVVLPTGAGKSVAFELPPLYSKRVTLLGLPHKLLISQVLKRASDSGLVATVWYTNTPRVVPPDLRLIVMPYECLLKEGFAE